MDDASPIKSKPVGRPPKVAKATGADGTGDEDVTARLKKERDGFVKQFEELSRLRTTESEALYEKLKARAEEKAKGKNGNDATDLSPSGRH